MAFELPEAITVSSQMNAELSGKKIEKAILDEKESASQIRWKMINLNTVDFASKLNGRIFKKIHSQGTDIYVDLGDDLTLVFGFGTSGKLLFHKDASTLPDKWNVRIDFSDKTALSYRAVAWGWCLVLTKEQLKAHRWIGKEEASLVDEEAFTFKVFSDYLDKYASKPIKFSLTRHGEALSGIGNGYLQDILFKAKIHPKRKARDIPEAERKNLHKAILKILKDAAKKGGRDTEVDIYDTPGRYRVILDKRMSGQPCPECGTTIEKSNILGSTCYVCPKCQK